MARYYKPFKNGIGYGKTANVISSQSSEIFREGLYRRCLLPNPFEYQQDIFNEDFVHLLIIMFMEVL